MNKKAAASHSTDDQTQLVSDQTTLSETAPENRDEYAAKLIDRFAVWAGLAGLLPLPLVDVAAVGGLQLQMVRRLSQIYGVPFSENNGKALIASLAGTAIPVTSGIGAASVLKALPVFGTALSALVMPALSSGATYAIGKVFVQHFASGGTLLDFNPPDYREFIKAQKEMWNARPSESPTSAQKNASSESGVSA